MLGIANTSIEWIDRYPNQIHTIKKWAIINYIGVSISLCFVLIELKQSMVMFPLS